MTAHAHRVIVSAVSTSHVIDNIRAEMARRKKTQGDLADLLGIARQGVSQRLAGQVDFRIGELQTIADYLGVPLAQLVDDDRASA